MTSTVAPRASTQETPIANEASRWDAAIQSLDGQLLQSWRWGAFKAKSGWDVARVVVHTDEGLAMAQILFRGKAGLSIGYIPRGPVLPPGSPPRLLRELWASVDNAARTRRAVSVIAEPDRDLGSVPQGMRLAAGPAHIQPSRTVKIPLLDDQPLLAQMHQKTRYNIRLAQRRGVQVRQAAASDESVSTFYTLLEDTSSRNAFGIHEIGYYREFLRTFGEDAALLFAEVEGRPAAGLIAASCGEEAVYMYGASSTKDRAHAAGFLLQFEAMRWARDIGCKRYDLWGIPATDPDSTKVDHGDRIAGTSGDDWRGLYEFKTRFGGEIVSYPPTIERNYHPVLASMARKLYRPWA